MRYSIKFINCLDEVVKVEELPEGTDAARAASAGDSYFCDGYVRLKALGADGLIVVDETGRCIYDNVLC